MPVPPVVGLRTVERGFTVPEHIALRDVAIRERFAGTVLWLFVATNAFVLTALGILYWQDVAQVATGRIAPTRKPAVAPSIRARKLGVSRAQGTRKRGEQTVHVPADRIIDAKVIMTLLDATTIRLGAVIYTMARAIFPAVSVRD